MHKRATLFPCMPSSVTVWQRQTVCSEEENPNADTQNKQNFILTETSCLLKSDLRIQNKGQRQNYHNLNWVSWVNKTMEHGHGHRNRA